MQVVVRFFCESARHMTYHHNVQFAEPLDLVMNFISVTFLNLMKVSSLPETTLQPISMLKSNKLILQKQKFKTHCKILKNSWTFSLITLKNNKAVGLKEWIQGWTQTFWPNILKANMSWLQIETLFFCTVIKKNYIR